MGSCPETLLGRVSVTDVPLDHDIRYKRPAYDLIPQDERLALAVGPDGLAQVAWLENELTRVHVTPLTAAGNRRDEDSIVPARDIGGLVLHSDGFALLTRRDDPGEPLRDLNPTTPTLATAAVLLRYRNGQEEFAAPLTGTAQLDPNLSEAEKRDCAPRPFLSRLVYNGQKYGAYFTVHGCEGHPRERYYADKLSYVDDQGGFVPGGWAWNCSINEGVRLLPEAGAFTSLCMAVTFPAPGLNLVIGGRASVPLAEEYTTGAYSGGEFGSVVKLGDGSYFVGWLSRGENPGQTPADIVFQLLGPDYRPRIPTTRLSETPTVAEKNLHFARYGSDKLLMVWDSVEELRWINDQTCFGTYTGTHLRLIDLAGNPVSDDEVIAVPPNAEDEIVVYPNGDLGWAFVREDARGYAGPLRSDRDGVPDVPTKRLLSIVRMRYCQ
ncbi:MAG TPA: hypothetical protein VFQ61_05990 [Polyangiaceae bacterium]|nr:hypothetical protein [Polyangiaceae bacterium]